MGNALFPELGVCAPAVLMSVFGQLSISCIDIEGEGEESAYGTRMPCLRFRRYPPAEPPVPVGAMLRVESVTLRVDSFDMVQCKSFVTIAVTSVTAKRPLSGPRETYNAAKEA